MRDLAPDGRSAAAPGGETAREVKAVLSVAGNLALRYLRETGDVEESAARAAAFANDAIERILLTAADGGNDQRAGDAEERIPAAGGQNPAREGEVEVDAKPAQADNAKSMPQSQVSQAQVSQGHPWPASPVRPKFGR